MTYLKKRKLGNLGEFLVKTILKAKAHKIVCENFTTQKGEIDLITTKDNTIYFIESKLTTTPDYGLEQKWKSTQLKHMHKSISAFLSENQHLSHYNCQILFIHFDFSKKNKVILNHYLVDN